MGKILGVDEEGDDRLTRETDKPHQSFPNTSWSLLGLAGRGNDEERSKALNELVQRYRPALCSYLIHQKRLQVAEADDLLQEFLLDKFVEGEILKTIVRGPGRFRSLLRVSLDHFCVSKHREKVAAKRYAKGSVPIEEAIEEAGVASDPTKAYEVAWVRQLLSDAIKSMRKKCQITGRMDVWDVCHGRLLDPLLRGATPAAYAEIVAQHRLVSPEQASNLLVTAKRMLRKGLRDRIAEYQPNEAMIDAEITDLLRILSGGNMDEKGATKWGRLLALTHEDMSGWLPGELDEIWRHQLAAPLTVELSQSYEQWARSSDQPAPIRTIGDLLGHSAPPLGLLKLVKDLAVERRSRTAFPSEIATALYYVTAAVALAQHRERITELDNASLCRGFNWAAHVSWLDEPTRNVLETALTYLLRG